ncbi:MAG: gliding motility-associated C-terminal domain-containing protein [Bacteroidales bacterium]|nr:gliding motility-associated C-terminal domain-containing protein [Candidatus Physcousia equi]
MLRQLLLYLFFLCAGANLCAQRCEPTALFVTTSGEELTDASTAQNAPLVAHFKSNPKDAEYYSARFEWKIFRTDDASETPIVHRFDQDLDYTFDKSGSFLVKMSALFVEGNDTVAWPETPADEVTFEVLISESKLEMPNAFSPNGDGYNDVYNAKPGFQSIVSFKASIFNRWGQHIYSWTNPDRTQAGWDGTWHGRKVGDGAYFVVVTAKGADGTDYKIRKDVNVLTGYDRSVKEGTKE